MAGLVKSHMEAKEIPCKIGLPHYLDSATEVNARARRQQATIRIGPVSVYLAVVRVQYLQLPNVGMGRHPFSSSNSLVIVGVGK